MASSFPLTSDYIEAEGIFTQKSKPLVLVEGYSDISLWGKIFEKLGFACEIKPYCENGKANGKATIIKDIKDGVLELGSFLLVALDSDYDYLLDIDSNLYLKPAVFQTYVHSSENLLWHPMGLDAICRNAFQTTDIPDNFIKERLVAWSRFVYNDFVEFVLCKQCSDNELKNKIINELNPNKYDFQYDELATVDRDVSPLEGKGVTTDNVFLFVRGHDFEEQMQQLCKTIYQSCLDIRKKALSEQHGDKACQFIREYCNHTSEVTSKSLSTSSLYECDFFFSKFQDDFKAFKAAY